MKEITYTVTVEFNDKIDSDKEINEVGENIFNGLIQIVNEQGLAPFYSETFTKSIVVSKDGFIISHKSFI